MRVWPGTQHTVSRALRLISETGLEDGGVEGLAEHLGIGARHPQSRLSFMLFTPGTSSPDWFEGGIDGEESKTSVGATGFIDEDLMNRLALQSAQEAYAKIGKDGK